MIYLSELLTVAWRQLLLSAWSLLMAAYGLLIDSLQWREKRGEKEEKKNKEKGREEAGRKRGTS